MRTNSTERGFPAAIPQKSPRNRDAEAHFLGTAEGNPAQQDRATADTYATAGKSRATADTYATAAESHVTASTNAPAAALVAPQAPAAGSARKGWLRSLFSSPKRPSSKAQFDETMGEADRVLGHIKTVIEAHKANQSHLDATCVALARQIAKSWNGVSTADPSVPSVPSARGAVIEAFDKAWRGELTAQDLAPLSTSGLHGLVQMMTALNATAQQLGRCDEAVALLAQRQSDLVHTSEKLSNNVASRIDALMHGTKRHRAGLVAKQQALLGDLSAELLEVAGDAAQVQGAVEASSQQLLALQQHTPSLHANRLLQGSH